MTAPLIRPVEAGERAAWQRLWRGYLDFYKASVPEEATGIAWRRLHDPAEPIFVLGAYLDGDLMGIAHYLFHRSTWTPGDYCYLQDLFVDAVARGHGIGRALIEAVSQKARAQGASRVYWLTREDNATARALYDKLAERSGFIQYRRVF